MKPKIDSLKYAVFNEWSYDPPAGGITLYYSAWGNYYKDLFWPVEETYDHLIDTVYDDECDELKAAYNYTKRHLKQIKDYGWENGGLGCGCNFVAEGKEIASKAAEFYQEEFAAWFEDDEEEEIAKRECILKTALDNPDDYEAVIELLEMISELIELRNDSVL